MELEAPAANAAGGAWRNCAVDEMLDDEDEGAVAHSARSSLIISWSVVSDDDARLLTPKCVLARASRMLTELRGIDWYAEARASISARERAAGSSRLDRPWR